MMKKIITLVLLTVACLSTAQATKVWPSTEGQTATYNGWDLKDGDQPILLGAEQLAGAKTGDRLIVQFTIIDASKWSAINVWDKATTNAFYDSGSVAGKTKQTITITDAMVAALTDSIRVTGCNVVISEVDLEAGEVKDAEGKIWPDKEGTTVDLGNWTGSLSITPDAYKGLAKGDKIVVKFNATAGADGYAIELWTTDFAHNFGSNQLKAEDTQTEFLIDDNTLAGIVAGFALSGCNVVITEVDIVKAKASTIALWPTTEGETTTFTGWNRTAGEHIVIDAEVFAGVALGDTLVIDYAPVGAETDWHAVNVWNADGSSIIFDEGIDFAATQKTFIINQTFLDLSKDGIKFTGSNITYKKISIRKKNTDTPVPVLSPDAIWPAAAGASTTFTGWSKTAGDDIVLEGSKFDKAAVGDKVVIKITPVGTNDDYHEVDLFDTSYTGTITDALTFDTTASELTITITADLLAKLKLGCVVTGSNVTVTEVDLKLASAINALRLDTPRAHAVYTLSGQRVTTPTAPGLYIVNGKKIVKK
jgi:hypothetical protein